MVFSLTVLYAQGLQALPTEQWEDIPKKAGLAHGGFFIQISAEHSSCRIKAANPEFTFKIGNPRAWLCTPSP